MKSWIEISEQALLANYRALTRAASASPDPPPTPVLAVVKANAYGHGLALCAPVLANAGAPWLGVTDVHEALVARKALAAAAIPPKAQPHILLMSGLLPGDAEAILEHHLTPVVWTPLQLDWLDSAARRSPSSETLPLHLEIDTGMSRQGARPGAELAAFLDRLATSENLTLGGVFTHFASSEVPDSPQTAAQQKLFETALEQLRQHTVFYRRNTVENPLRADQKTPFPLWIHASNSSALDLASTPKWLNRLARRMNARPLARAGLALYGYTLPTSPATSHLHPNLIPALTWKTRILDLRDLPAHATIGYNATFSTKTPLRTALLPVGYADGLRRELSSTSTHPSGWAMVHGEKASILGRISMNLSSLDASRLTCRVNDEVTLLGPGITACDHACLAGTIPYEILCGLRATSRLVP